MWSTQPVTFPLPNYCYYFYYYALLFQIRIPLNVLAGIVCNMLLIFKNLMRRIECVCHGGSEFDKDITSILYCRAGHALNDYPKAELNHTEEQWARQTWMSGTIEETPVLHRYAICTSPHKMVQVLHHKKTTLKMKITRTLWGDQWRAQLTS